MSDRPQPPQRGPVTLSGVMLACFVCALLLGASGLVWAVLRPERVWDNVRLTNPPTLVASPVVIVQPPVVPAVLVQMADAYVKRATETAPTPTWTPTPIVVPTHDPTHFCGIDSVKDQLCRWPLPPLPTPTPFPDCNPASPTPSELCYWRES